jgi:hypothetical protein
MKWKLDEKLTVLESPKSPIALLAIEYNLSLWGFPFLSIPSGITPIDCPSLYGTSPKPPQVTNQPNMIISYILMIQLKPKKKRGGDCFVRFSLHHINIQQLDSSTTLACKTNGQFSNYTFSISINLKWLADDLARWKLKGIRIYLQCWRPCARFHQEHHHQWS